MILPARAEQQDRFYVYAVAINGRIEYIGKGTGRRAWAHLGKSCQNPLLRDAIASARARSLPVKVRKLRDGLTEHEALKLERALIVRNHKRLLNRSLGNQSYWESLLAKLNYEWRCLKSEDQICSEGEWRGLSLDKRLECSRLIRASLAELIILARDNLGIA